ncbi:hypothetical protein RRG08_022930 [Elysia crispata]|uniref:Uncharacterized protein n=1 Tax=Elysia crispata TaxID=231223 RepID=A0AAE1CJ32_9GAST|nr:hypothetical protein RRG08_022930 [Elysia crispata]
MRKILASSKRIIHGKPHTVTVPETVLKSSTDPRNSTNTMFELTWTFLACSIILATAPLGCCEVLLVSRDGQSVLGGQTLGSCAEPGNLTGLYRQLREQQILVTSTVEEWRPPPSTISSSSMGASSVTRLAGHHQASLDQAFSGVCRCRSMDELNHDPTRIPRMIPQSSCRPHRPWRTSVFSAECEDVYKAVKVKRRTGCSNGVYQYTDAWESIPVGCRCQVYRRVVVTRY